jgi:hypothetical protein
MRRTVTDSSSRYPRPATGDRLVTGEIYCAAVAQNHLVIPDTMQGRVVWVGDGVLQQCVIHWLIPVGLAVNVALADAISTAIGNLWNTNLAAHANAQQGFSGVILRDLRQPSMAEVSTTVTGHGGTAVGDSLPRSIAACLTLRTTNAGRKFRGRMYIPCFAEEANGASGAMSAATKTSLDAFAVGLVAAANQSGAQLAVAHRPTQFDPNTGLPISPGLGFSTPVTQAVCRDTRWDSQRRRNR